MLLPASAWGKLKQEIGRHCIQRIPPTEKKGRRHTSYCMVSGQRLNNCAPDLRAADIKYSTHRGTGKGGQHQNTTDSAVRATHIPTGLHISIQGRSQVANKREGAKLLAQQVFAQHGTQSNQHAAHLKRQQYTQGSKVRTWNYIENRVIDHTTNSKHSLKGFIKSARIPQLKK